jgi:hypothetical protein
MPPAPKRSRLDPEQAPAPSKPFLTLAEANELKDEIAQLESDHQFKILEILQVLNLMLD